jgi:trehalose 6-phosphate phosphatase
MKSVAAEVGELIAPLRAEPEASAVISDIDGTLAPIVTDPAAAEVPGVARDVLGELAARYALVGCLSGRAALEARRIVGLDQLVYAGNHGYELLRPGDRAPVADPAVSGREHAARRFVEGLDQRRLAAAGIRTEDKGPIVALHWRGAEDERAAEELAQEVGSSARDGGLVPHSGRKVLEIRPVAGVDKGSAIGLLMEGGRIANALYGGDDVTDLDAFATLADWREDGRLRHAVCVGISSGEGPSALSERADVLVDGPDGYLTLLRALIE